MTNIRKTSDGSDTLYVPELDEHYHSVHGAIGESSFIFVNAGFLHCTASPVRIFEAGFGTGLNALLTALKARETGKSVFYCAIEKYPLEMELIKSLNYSQFTGAEGREIFERIHSSPWNEETAITENFSLFKLNGDLTAAKLTGEYDVIYFDAFGPDKQPDMWTPEIFASVSSVTATNGIFVTYSAKGEVKRKLRACGFEVFLLPGPPGKRQIIRAIKK